MLIHVHWYWEVCDPLGVISELSSAEWNGNKISSFLFLISMHQLATFEN